MPRGGRGGATSASGRPFSQVDVFGSGPLGGNPVAVVHDADGLDADRMQPFANWTNLSETTFLLAPSVPGADYRLRIFTPAAEIPFAGHPTLGSAHAWLERGRVPATPGTLVQECGAGLVRLRDGAVGLAFEAPPLRRSGPVEPGTLARAVRALGVDPALVLAAAWVDNGPGWLGLRLGSAADVLALRPDFGAFGDLVLGVVGAHPADGPADAEVRAFAPGLGVPEDPVTGSLNAGLAQWLLGEGVYGDGYTARQGTALGRSGRVDLSREGGAVWVGGACRTVVSGTVAL